MHHSVLRNALLQVRGVFKEQRGKLLCASAAVQVLMFARMPYPQVCFVSPFPLWSSHNGSVLFCTPGVTEQVRMFFFFIFCHGKMLSNTRQSEKEWDKGATRAFFFFNFVMKICSSIQSLPEWKPEKIQNNLEKCVNLMKNTWKESLIITFYKLHTMIFLKCFSLEWLKWKMCFVCLFLFEIYRYKSLFLTN